MVGLGWGTEAVVLGGWGCGGRVDGWVGGWVGGVGVGVGGVARGLRGVELLGGWLLVLLGGEGRGRFGLVGGVV